MRNWPRSWTFEGVGDEDVTFWSLLKMYLMAVPLVITLFGVVIGLLALIKVVALGGLGLACDGW